MRQAFAALLCFSVLTMWMPERWPLTVFQAGVFALAFLFMLRELRGPAPVRTQMMLVPLTAALVWGALAIPTHRTIYAWNTEEALLNWAAGLALVFAALQIFADGAARKWFLSAVLYFGFVLSVISAVQLFTSHGKIFWLFDSGYTDSVLGPFVNRNQYAAFMELIVPLAVYRALTEGPRALYYFAMAAAIGASVIAGGSRAGSVIVVLEVLMVLILAWRRRMITGRKFGIIVAQLALLGAAFIAVAGVDRLLQSLNQRDFFAGRRDVVRSSVDMVRANPVWGVGLGNWALAYPHYAHYDDGVFVNQAHNDWVQWADEGGVPLFLMMLTIALLTARLAARSIWGIGLVAILLHALVDYPFQQRPAIASFFWAMLGVLAAASQDSSGETGRPPKRARSVAS